MPPPPPPPPTAARPPPAAVGRRLQHALWAPGPVVAAWEREAEWAVTGHSRRLHADCPYIEWELKRLDNILLAAWLSFVFLVGACLPMGYGLSAWPACLPIA